MAGVSFRDFKFGVCTTEQPSDLNAVGFGGLTYVDVCCLAEVPEFSSQLNVITENCIDGSRLTALGADEPADGELTVFYVDNCLGQEELRDMALAKDGKIYAVQKLYSDGVSGVTTPTVEYARVMFTGFTSGSGGIEDFVQHTFSFTIQQGPLLVEPASI